MNKVEYTIYNISTCSFAEALSGGEKFTYEIIPRLAVKNYSINFFGYNISIEEWDKNKKNTMPLSVIYGIQSENLSTP